MPLERFPEITLPSPAFGPPIARVGLCTFPGDPVSRIPSPLGSAAAPVIFTPIQFPLTALPFEHSLHWTPASLELYELPEIRLRSPAAAPPIVLPETFWPR